MIGKQMKNERGFTLIEMLVAMTLGIVVLGAAIYTYNKQNAVIRKGNQATETRGMARLALDALVTDIQLAGHGMPPGDSKINNGATPPVYSPRNAQGISKASSTSVTYLANTDEIKTFIARDPGSNPANGFVVAYQSAATGDPDTTFATGDQVVLFDISSPATTFRRVITSLTSPLSISGVNYDLISLNANVDTTNIKPIRDSVPVMISKYHEITYSFNAGAQTVTMTDDQGTSPTGDDTTRVIATNVTNLTFTYFDSFDAMVDVSTPLDWANGATDQDELGRIRGMAINMTVQDQNEPTVTTTLTTGVTLRNMGV